MKADGHALSDDDRDQGISYARLLEEIAPFVMLTNGRETKVFDTITREEIGTADRLAQTEFWRNDCVLASGVDLRIRCDALRHFIGYSPANVRTFSSLQQRARMLGLLGSTADRTKKYIPEIYVPRHQAREAIDSFMLRGEPVFALVGEAGVGKTNEMCALAEYLGNRHLALFFSASGITTTLQQTLADDFNWFFAEHRELAQIIRNLESIVSGTDSKVAIAMCPDEDARSPADDAPLAEKRKPTCLNPLSAAEIETFLDRYVAFFALPERPRGKLKEHCRSPFMLRIASEVYGGSTDSLPNDISVSELCEAWLEKKLARMPERTRSSASAALWELGKALAEPQPLDGADLGEESIADSLSEYELCRRCGGPITVPVADELVSQGVLIRIDRADGPTLRFYFSEVRNFFVARYVLRLQDWPGAELRDRLPALLRGYVTCEALYWYLPDASAAHIEVWMSDLVGRVLLFLSSYERILENLGSGIREGVEPYSSGPIGIAYEIGVRGLRRWGLFPCIGSANLLVEIARELADVGADGECDEPYWKLGCHTVHYGGESIFAYPAKDAAEFLKKESTAAIRRGRLDESGSLTLQKERVWALVSRSDCWGFLKHHARDKWTDSGRPMVEGCLDLGEIARRFQVSFGVACYRSQHGRGLNEGSAVFSIAEENCARSWAEAQVDAGQTFPEPQPWVYGPWIRGLWAAVCACRGKNAQAIAQPYASSALYRILRDDPTALLREEVESALTCLFSEGINAYRCLIERNFWGRRGLFSLYSRLSATAVAIVGARRGESDTDRWIVDYGFVQADAADSPPRIVFDDDADGDQARRLLSSALYGCCTSLRNLLHPYTAPGFGVTRFEQWGGEYAPVRALAYHLIAGEFETIPQSALDPGV